MAVKSCIRAIYCQFTFAPAVRARVAQTHLVVNIETIQVVLLHPGRHGVRGRDGAEAGRRGLLGRTEAGDHERDAGLLVL